jgi:hypothetical protein
MAKKQIKPKLQTHVKIAKIDLINMLRETHELGYMTGKNQQETYADEQRDDCMGVVEEHFDICNN